jgi:hypothetical protein
MESDLQITIKGLPDELANNVGNAVASIIKNFEASNPSLDFRRMHHVIIASDFAGELAALSCATASGNPITHTNEEYAVAVAKILLFPRAEGYEILPVINAHVAMVLTQPEQNPEGFQYVVHLLHHELCHVHDENKQLDAFPNIILRHKYSGKDRFLGPLAERCWSEYIANFLSSSTATEESVLAMIKSFAKALERTKIEIDTEILLYRNHADLNLLLSIFGRHGEFLIISAAYILGYMEGLKKSLLELSPQTSESLSGSYFEATWNAMNIALQEMHKLYHNQWHDFGIYNELKLVVENYYADMGLILETLEDGGVYVHVP